MMKPGLKKWFHRIPHGLRYWLFKNFFKTKFTQFSEIRKNGQHGYSLKESEDKGMLFIHVPKNGGTSINRALFKSEGAGHLAYYFMELIYSPVELKSFLKFAFVRNPWSRLYSAFSYLSQGGGTVSDKQWAKEHIADVKDFEDFIMNWISEDRLFSYIHLYPQNYYITDAWGRVKLDFIGRFENMESDFAHLIRERGIQAELPHLNASKKSETYRIEYTEEMKAKVAELYKKDIELFAYQF